MRKRTVKNVAETILWYTLYLLPIICLLIGLLSFKTESYVSYFFSIDSDVTNLDFTLADTLFWEVMANFISCDNLVVVSLEKIFGAEGILPLFAYSASGTLLYCSWLVCVTLLRLFVDFILFIPRLAQKWMSGFTQGD